MKFSALAIICTIKASSAFVHPAQTSRPTILNGYLDDLSAELYAPDDNPDPEATSHEATKMKEEDKDRYGVGSWDDYVEFDEFDGGDGQMGVAGDGNKSLKALIQGKWQNQSPCLQRLLGVRVQAMLIN